MKNFTNEEKQAANQDAGNVTDITVADMAAQRKAIDIEINKACKSGNTTARDAAFKKLDDWFELRNRLFPKTAAAVKKTNMAKLRRK